MGSRYSKLLEEQYTRLQEALALADEPSADDAIWHEMNGEITDQEAAKILAWNYRKQHETSEHWRRKLEEAEMMIIELIRMLSELTSEDGSWDAAPEPDNRSCRERLAHYGPHITDTISRARDLVGLSLLDDLTV